MLKKWLVIVPALLMVTAAQAQAGATTRMYDWNFIEWSNECTDEYIEVTATRHQTQVRSSNSAGGANYNRLINQHGTGVSSETGTKYVVLMNDMEQNIRHNTAGNTRVYGRTFRMRYIAVEGTGPSFTIEWDYDLRVVGGVREINDTGVNYTCR